MSKPDTYVVGLDPVTEDLLAVVPLGAVQKDLEIIDGLLHARTLQELRRRPAAWHLVAQRFELGVTPLEDPEGNYPETLEDAPLDATFNFFEWFGDSDAYAIPLLHVRTAELAPPEILREFGEPPESKGIDVFAVWIDPAKQDAVERRLQDLGYSLRSEPELLQGYGEPYGS